MASLTNYSLDLLRDGECFSLASSLEKSAIIVFASSQIIHLLWQYHAEKLHLY